MPLPRKLRSPMNVQDNRNEVLENSMFIIDSASATIVPVPMELAVRASCFTMPPKFAPVWNDLSEVVPDAPQVVHDPRGIADETAQGLGIGQARSAGACNRSRTGGRPCYAR